MAEPYRTDYLRTPNSQRFTRQRLMFPLVRALQRNAQHLWGTRVQPLVKDFDRFETIPAAFDAAVGGTSPEYYVRVSRGATRLLGTILWTADQWEDEGTTVEGQFYSERGGAGVAAALDVVTAATVTDSAFRLDRGNFDPFDPNWDRGERAPEPDAPLIEDQYGERIFAPRWLGGELAVGVSFASWTPDLTTSHDQRIQCRTRATANQGNAILVGVYVLEEVPQT